MFSVRMEAESTLFKATS